MSCIAKILSLYFMLIHQNPAAYPRKRLSTLKARSNLLVTIICTLNTMNDFIRKGTGLTQIIIYGLVIASYFIVRTSVTPSYI